MSQSQPVAVVIGATSKWQSDGRNTHLVHGDDIDDADLPPDVRWGVGGALALKFAREGFSVVVTTRTAANASALEAAIREEGGEARTVELDVESIESITRAFREVAESVGTPEVVVYNVGYIEGRDLPDTPFWQFLERLGLVGESGSGKSVTAKSLMMLNAENSVYSDDSKITLKVDGQELALTLQDLGIPSAPPTR